MFGQCINGNGCIKIGVKGIIVFLWRIPFPMPNWPFHYVWLICPIHKILSTILYHNRPTDIRLTVIFLKFLENSLDWVILGSNSVFQTIRKKYLTKHFYGIFENSKKNSLLEGIEPGSPNVTQDIRNPDSNNVSKPVWLSKNILENPRQS